MCNLNFDLATIKAIISSFKGEKCPLVPFLVQPLLEKCKTLTQAARGSLGTSYFKTKLGAFSTYK